MSRARSSARSATLAAVCALALGPASVRGQTAADTTATKATTAAIRYEARHTVTAVVRDGAVRVTVSSPVMRRREQVTVFRRLAPALRLGNDRAALTHLDTTGSVELRKVLIRSRRVTFTDSGVDLRRTYAYWIRSANGITRPLAVRVRDQKMWWNKDDVSRTIRRLSGTYPRRVDIATYGHTRDGWELEGVRAGNRDVTVALVGSVHAGESGPEIILPVFERLLTDDADLLADVGLAVLPLVNADERERLYDGNAWYLRKNAGGVDINRNFDAQWDVVDNSYNQSTDNPSSGTYRGPRPASESETRAVMAFVEATRPDAVLSFHGLTTVTGPLFVTAVDGSPHYYAATTEVARAYQSGYAGDPVTFDDTPIQIMQRSVAGSLALWVSLHFDVPAADLEFDRGPLMDAAVMDMVRPEQLEEAREHHYQAVKRLLEYLRDNKDP